MKIFFYCEILAEKQLCHRHNYLINDFTPTSAGFAVLAFLVVFLLGAVRTGAGARIARRVRIGRTVTLVLLVALVLVALVLVALVLVALVLLTFVLLALIFLALVLLGATRVSIVEEKFIVETRAITFADLDGEVADDHGRTLTKDTIGGSGNTSCGR